MDGQEWYIQAFDEWYPIVYQHRDDKEAQYQVDFAISELNLKDNCRVLDLCCGYGRHIKYLNNKVFQVVGYDLSLYLLNKAKEFLSNKVFLVKGDVRNLPFPSECFDAVLNFFTSFGYFKEHKDNVQQIEQVSCVLKSGGRFLFDYFNPIQAKKIHDVKTEREFKTYIIKERRWYDKENKEIKKSICIYSKDRCFEKSYLESVKVYTFDELSEMFSSSKLQIKNVYGNYNKEKFTSESPRLIIIGVKNE